MKNKNLTDSLAELNSKLTADYVVEQGNGYTKWNSGKLECWGSAKTGNDGYIAISYPVSFSGTTYSLIASAQYYGSSYTNITTLCQRLSGATANLYTRLASSASPLASVPVDWQAIGRWK